MPRALTYIATPALTAVLTFGLLVACQPTSTGPDYTSGSERLVQCQQTTCTRLDLDGTSLEDYTQLASMPHITALMMSYTSFSSLDDIAAMTQLQELHIGNTSVTDLSSLSAFANLQVLHIQQVQPESWAPLATLGQLQELAIGHYEMDDLSIIAQLPKLQRLRIMAAGSGASLDMLGRHPGLLTLDISDADFQDYSPLLRLPNLRELAINEFQAETHADVITALRARGVTISITPTIVVC